MRFRELLRRPTCTHPAEWTSDVIEIGNSVILARHRRKRCMRCGRTRTVSA